MAGRPKQGIDYAGWSVDIFDGDTKIDKLLDAQGWVGFSVYFYLCLMAYKFDGYYYKWSYDDAASTARRMGGGVGSQTVINTVGLCLQIGLFDKNLFDRDGILTSRGIQRRYKDATSRRTNRQIVAEYWLLDATESEGLVFCTLNSDSCMQRSDVGMQEKPSLQRNVASMPQSKVKESKVKESKVVVAGAESSDAGRATTTVPSLKEILLFCKEEKLNISPERFFNVNEARNWLTNQGLPISDWKALAREWNRTERPKTAPAGRGRAAGRQRGAAAYEPSAWAGYEEE